MYSPEISFAMLLRDKPLTEQEWEKINSELVEKLRPNLDSFTLGRLCLVECLAQAEHTRPIGVIHTEVEVIASAPIIHGLEEQGLFRVGPKIFRHATGPSEIKFIHPQPRRNGGTVMIWGLTRNAKWIVAEIEFKDFPGYKNRGEEIATKVTIKEISYTELLEKAKINGQHIWNFLRDGIKLWVSHCHQRLLQAQTLLDATDKVNDVVVFIEQKNNQSNNKQE